MKELDNIKDYWDKRAPGYSEKSAAELSGIDAHIWSKRLSDLLPTKKELCCLDIGCGPGFLGILLCKMGHCVTFSDYSQGMLDQAKLNVQGEGYIFNSARCDAQNTDFDDESFDVIVSRNLVWNLESPQCAYKEWLRILKPGGKIVVFDGNHYLHHYNDTYKQHRSNPEFNDVHTPQYMKGIDPAKMSDIAKKLPLSKQERPRWDMEFFLNNRVSSIYTIPSYTKFTDSDNTEQIVIDEFTICIQK